MKQLEFIQQKRIPLINEYSQLTYRVGKSRDKVISDLDQLTELAVTGLKAKGCYVYKGQDVATIQNIIFDLCQEDSQIVILEGEDLAEINLTDVPWTQGTTMHRSDLGAIILAETQQQQLRHPLLKNLETLSSETIMQALAEYTASEEQYSAEQLMQLAHKKIKQHIVASDYGITGCQGVIADTGTVVIAEEVGNGRMVSNLPYRHIVVAGIDKLYCCAEDAMEAVQATYIYGLGKKAPNYISFISGQSRTGDICCIMTNGMHGPLEVHVILLDNGRSELLAKGYGHALKCIECGSCYHTLEKLANKNRWVDLMLTPKNIALKLLRKEIFCHESILLEPFACPVGMNEEDIQSLLMLGQEMQ